MRSTIVSLIMAFCCAVPLWAAPAGALAAPSSDPVILAAQAQPQLGDDLSPAQKQRFDGKRVQLKRELDVCKEHCGKDEACAKKCDDTYKARLENEYQAAKSMKKGG